MKGHIDQLLQLFDGVVYDGHLISKTSRDALYKAKYCARVGNGTSPGGGWNVITPLGIMCLERLGLIHSGTIRSKK